LVKVLVGGTGVFVKVLVAVFVLVGELVKVLVGGTGVLVLVLVGVLVFVGVLVEVAVLVRVKVLVKVLVLVGVFVLVGVEPLTVTQEFVAPIALQMPVTAAFVYGKPCAMSHIPMPLSPWPLAQLILVQ
jgi:hypothetical protein